VAPSTKTASAQRRWRELAAEAESCTACDLFRDATQTVFGAGDVGAAVVLVGEQPGDVEDLEGVPFAGPAGRMLDEVLEELGVDRSAVYVTNAVKHFKWKPRGKRRIHQKPNASEIEACHPWLERELAVVDPRLVVAMGATAARAVLGRPVTISSVRGRILDEAEPPAVVTIHPSAILRARDDREAMRRGFRDDLALAFGSVER
jgi:DNA polymerase